MQPMAQAMGNVGGNGIKVPEGRKKTSPSFCHAEQRRSPRSELVRSRSIPGQKDLAGCPTSGRCCQKWGLSRCPIRPWTTVEERRFSAALAHPLGTRARFHQIQVCYRLGFASCRSRSERYGLHQKPVMPLCMSDQKLRSYEEFKWNLRLG